MYCCITNNNKHDVRSEIVCGSHKQAQVYIDCGGIENKANYVIVTLRNCCVIVGRLQAITIERSAVLVRSVEIGQKHGRRKAESQHEGRHQVEVRKTQPRFELAIND